MLLKELIRIDKEIVNVDAVFQNDVAMEEYLDKIVQTNNSWIDQIDYVIGIWPNSLTGQRDWHDKLAYRFGALSTVRAFMFETIDENPAKRYCTRLSSAAAYDAPSEYQFSLYCPTTDLDFTLEPPRRTPYAEYMEPNNPCRVLFGKIVHDR